MTEWGRGSGEKEGGGPSQGTCMNDQPMDMDGRVGTDCGDGAWAGQKGAKRGKSGQL